MHVDCYERSWTIAYKGHPIVTDTPVNTQRKEHTMDMLKAALPYLITSTVLIGLSVIVSGKQDTSAAVLATILFWAGVITIFASFKAVFGD